MVWKVLQVKESVSGHSGWDLIRKKFDDFDFVTLVPHSNVPVHIGGARSGMIAIRAPVTRWFAANVTHVSNARYLLCEAMKALGALESFFVRLLKRNRSGRRVEVRVRTEVLGVECIWNNNVGDWHERYSRNSTSNKQKVISRQKQRTKI